MAVKKLSRMELAQVIHQAIRDVRASRRTWPYQEWHKLPPASRGEYLAAAAILLPVLRERFQAELKGEVHR